MNLEQDYERLDDLLIPALAFDSPMEVVEDPDLTVGEKRSLLAAWASDARAVENNPALRRVRGNPVAIDDILLALRILDRPEKALQRARKAYRHASIEGLRGTSGPGREGPDAGTRDMG